MRHLAQTRNPDTGPCFWIPGSLALLAPRNDDLAAFADWSRHLQRLWVGLNPALMNSGRERGILMQMSNEGILVILFVGLVAGWLAGKIVRGTGFGIIGDILVGIAGALVASYLFPKLGIHLGTGLLSEIIYSAIGAILLLLIVRLVRTGGRF
jgi:uncharacterized membrane protein YeaQ/YmgE (transglycosylase-associated protein family)